uniref:Secreted protein n=1 Tax=Lutzomyia longipalpis TaxID=7200 RepID=A0A1B0CJP3_LUTLO
MPSVQKFMISGVILFFILSVDLCLGEESTLSDASVGVGVIATLLATLTVISLKGLGVGVILLVLSIGQLLARGLPQLTTPPTTYAASPASIIYGRSDVRNPVWIEKDWTS